MDLNGSANRKRQGKSHEAELRRAKRLDSARLEATERAIADAGGLDIYLARQCAAGRISGSIVTGAVERLLEQRAALLKAAKLVIAAGPACGCPTHDDAAKALEAAVANVARRA